MKKFISLILIVCLCLFLSTVFTFAADQAVSDSTTHTRLQTIINWLQNYAPTYNQMSTIASSLSTITGWTNSNGILTNINHNLLIACGFLDPDNQGSVPSVLTTIFNSLDNGGQDYSHYLYRYTGLGTSTYTSLESRNYSPLGYIQAYVTGISTSLYEMGRENFNYMLDGSSANNSFTYGYNTAQSFVDWSDPETSSTFTPTSATNGIYTWLSKIQAPVARLSYVLASDERIAAQEAAAPSEDAVIDNFIDSSGSGAASTSDFASISGLSSDFKDNLSTDASVSGIWNIFNSDNFGWFSQETANQLDTSGNNNRRLKSVYTSPKAFDTPLLDQKVNEILKYIGGDDND